MRLVWSEPPREVALYGPNKFAGYPRMFWEKAVLGWLNFCGVFPEEGRDTFRLEYNYFHHFYDITLFEHQKGGGNPRSAIERMEEYLKSSGLRWKSSYGWRWDRQADGRNKEIPGVRFWVFAQQEKT